MNIDFTNSNPEFDAWVKTLPAKYWARYDLSACRLGWEASREHTMKSEGGSEFPQTKEEIANLKERLGEQ